ncbi:hypothetical protein NB231_00175 [Nitrococcus mobilis Nb-231]|uniref:Uncharacterized protein n=1 Tax=Nitrococcus mobilis Nb-231 TaxID=314278 RepID=A4BTJ8_9GAMM|nr:hypothetical protein NB231_00175 [Nitrococcus mobilis Nb-231]
MHRPVRAYRDEIRGHDASPAPRVHVKWRDSPRRAQGRFSGGGRMSAWERGGADQVGWPRGGGRLW